jgi:hypothetical protein
MNMLFLFLVTAFQPAPKDTLYAYNEQVCSYAYAVTNSWELTLKEQGTFLLKYDHDDNRYTRKPAVDFHGVWKKNNDTLTLTLVYPLQNDCYFSKAIYIHSKDTLTALANSNTCLPRTLERVVIFSGPK